MNNLQLRSPKFTSAFAFLLGGLAGLLMAAPARSAELFRAARIEIARVTPTTNNQLLLRTGVLEISGEIVWRDTQTIPRPPGTPAWALDRNLVNATAWLAFYAPAGLSTADFALQEGGARVIIGDEIYCAIAPRQGMPSVAANMSKLAHDSKLPGPGGN